ncbi:hypothetical protein PMM47T1_20688 [Pseudomonas sp. M47T1]|uniref:hypothetical protein n=1 Tax=unclassified Pseudomonas TaxID=196821 RepID=UPI00026072F2|nr:hypothetical protein [Pseudomonas sp. M47T1]EIK94752.1 hypothetical protein PMM47T1_20688 [Pseudomonas sp. M47T1]
MGLFEIVFRGELVAGAQPALVKANLAKLFQADGARIDALFSGRRLVLKSDLDPQAAEKYRATLERAGIVVSIEPVPVHVEEIEMAPPPDAPGFVRRPNKMAEPWVPRDCYMAAFVEVQAPAFEVAEAGSDLQPQKPVAQAPRLDLGQFSLAPAGSDMGQAPRAAGPAAPDTSHLKITP